MTRIYDESDNVADGITDRVAEMEEQMMTQDASCTNDLAGSTTNDEGCSMLLTRLLELESPSKHSSAGCHRKKTNRTCLERNLTLVVFSLMLRTNRR